MEAWELQERHQVEVHETPERLWRGKGIEIFSYQKAYWPEFYETFEPSGQMAVILHVEDDITDMFFRIKYDQNSIIFHFSPSLWVGSKVHFYGSWLDNHMAIVESYYYRHYYAPIIMPHAKFTAVRDEITKVLQRYGVPDLAIREFIRHCSQHLRLALQKHAVLKSGRPQRWPVDRQPAENPIEFVRRLYGSRIDRGTFTQSDLATVDKKALIALRNYCGYRYARPKRPTVSEILPPAKKNPDDVVAKFGKLTYANSVGAWRKNPTRENAARKRAYNALQTRKSRARSRDPG